MARIRSGPPPPLLGDDDGFVSPEAAARRMGVTTDELLRLASMGVLATRGRGYGLRVRPAILSGAVTTRDTKAARDTEPVRASRDRALSGREAVAPADRPHVGFADG